MQNVADRHDTELNSPPTFGPRGGLHVPLSYVWSSPSKSTSMQNLEDEHETAARNPPSGSIVCGLPHPRPLKMIPSCWLTVAQNLAVGHETEFRPKLGTPPPLSILRGAPHLPFLEISARLLVSTATQNVVLRAQET